MHHCLLMTEILEVIFHFVFSEWEDSIQVLNDRSPLPTLLLSPYTQGRSLLHIALTYRVFFDPALNVLYSRMVVTRPKSPLIHERLTFICTPFPTDCELYLRALVLQAACVQILFNPWFNDNLNDTFNAFILANTPKDVPLFPRLHELAWFDMHLTSIPALSLLLPTLETLYIGVSSPPFHKAIIPHLHTAAPRLKALEFMGLNTICNDPSDMKSLIPSYSGGLIEMSFGGCNISSNLLHVIATWPRLRWLTMVLDSKSIPTVPFNVPQPFPALHHLHILYEDLRISESFLCAPISKKTDRCMQMQPRQRLAFLSILTCAKLEHIILAQTCVQSVWFCHRTSSIELHPLLMRPTSLADLKTLIISGAHAIPIVLNDTNILMLARTCPYLEILDLRARNMPVSLYTLDTLVRSCHELRRVSIRVDMGLKALRAMPPINDNDQAGLQPNSALIKLDVGSRPSHAWVP
ncbi:uncharacterized protein EDB91DRAFT_1273806 [Suillus paluster]|uniref:uncharacterized protein n=1 Tax=Suillus paluster TaxID=48578 RepID=UPI001B86EBF0|nr:uncharacterized protein EDB91DRAFT_1273806 [Suillus paluster]KAG1722378.1 hypothetical protein EDB91DRAFT_1273806 [Suillus paluster]